MKRLLLIVLPLLFIVGVLTILTASCTPAPKEVAERKTIWPGENWAISNPETMGMSSKVIQDLVKELEDGTYGSVDQFLFIKNGMVIADYKFDVNYKAILEEDGDNHPEGAVAQGGGQYNYDDTNWHPYYNGTSLHSLQSVTKSVTSAALGVAVKKGHIESENVNIAQFFTDYEYDLSDSRKSSITLEDFLSMRSGIDWNTSGGYADGEHSTVLLEASDKWIQFVLDRPMDETPGTIWEYNDGVSVLLGKIVRQATGQRIDEWAKENLFNPIGINDFYWKITPDGEADTEGGLYLSTHDLARIGYLFLKEGEWEGKQILSKEWVKKSVTPIVPDVRPNNDTVDPGYGYQWWIPSFGEGKPTIYAGNGYGGQFVMVAPEYDIVVVFNGWALHRRGEKSTKRVLENIIIPSLKDGK